MAGMNPTEEERLALAEWMTANGVDPESVPLESAFTIVDEPGGRLIHYTEFVLTDDGHKQADPERPDEVWKRPATAPCTVEPPAELHIKGAR
jgi:hypothetical protein